MNAQFFLVNVHKTQLLGIHKKPLVFVYDSFYIVFIMLSNGLIHTVLYITHFTDCQVGQNIYSDDEQEVVTWMMMMMMMMNKK